jgi:hypothetical protein
VTRLDYVRHQICFFNLFRLHLAIPNRIKWPSIKDRLTTHEIWSVTVFHPLARTRPTYLPDIVPPSHMARRQIDMRSVVFQKKGCQLHQQLVRKSKHIDRR